MKKLSLNEIRVNSFATSEKHVKGGATWFNCGTNYQNCDTANPDDCSAGAFCSNNGCTGNCTYIC